VDDQVTPPDGPLRGPYPKGVERRREILERAIEVFAERGAEKTSLRAIGEAIGVSHAALRHYFDSREQLLLEVLRSAEERSAQQSTVAPGASAVEVITDFARRNRDVPGLVQLYSTLLAGALEEGRDESKAFFVKRFDDVRRQLGERIESDQAAGLMPGDVDAQAAASLVIAASDGLQLQWLLDPSIDITRSLAILEGLFRPAPRRPAE
jgi:TetR/AcrR family transcriptional regulator, transcriptional repressor of aconitase